MAEALIRSPDSFNCPVCLDILKGPVTIPCGHSFCLDCIKCCWGYENQNIYSCPQCRQSFSLRPPLNKNTMLADLAEGLRKMRVRSGDVECDICTGSKLRAVKSCLVCLASFCEAHIQPHYDSPALKKHKLVEASRNLQEKICSVHDKLLEVFCCTDQQCICLLCVMDKHSGHKTVSAAGERITKLNKLGQNRQDCKQRIQQKEKKVEGLNRVMMNLKSSAQAAVDDSDKILTDLIKSIRRRRSEVRELIRDQEKTELSLAEDLLKKLEEEIVDLRRRDAELEQLSHTEDPIQFLQDYQFLPALPGITNLSSINTKPQFSVDSVKKFVSEMEKLNRFSKLEIVTAFQDYTVQSALPKTREEFLKYSCQLTLNPNTANRFLILSEGNKKATAQVVRPIHVTLYLSGYWLQVLCAEPLSGCSYWEVEISGDVSIAVTYKDISREGRETERDFGSNDQSWSLECSGSSLSFRHKDKVSLNVYLYSSRIGVYVDYRGGILSFYSVSNTMKLLHKVYTTFTRNLYPGFGMKPGNGSVKIVYNRVHTTFTQTRYPRFGYTQYNSPRLYDE